MVLRSWVSFDHLTTLQRGADCLGQRSRVEHPIHLIGCSTRLVLRHHARQQSPGMKSQTLKSEQFFAPGARDRSNSFSVTANFFWQKSARARTVLLVRSATTPAHPRRHRKAFGLEEAILLQVEGAMYPPAFWKAQRSSCSNLRSH